MNRKLLAGIFSAAMLALGSMTAFANGGTGIYSDPDGSFDWDPHKVICLEDVQFKDYIDDSDEVIGTLPVGTIFEMDNKVLRKGEDTGWANACVPRDDKSIGDSYFERSKVQKYDPRNPVEIEKSEDNKSLIVRLPRSGDESYEYTVSDPEKIHKLNCEDTDTQFAIHFEMITEKGQNDCDIFADGTIHFVGKVDGEITHDFTLTIYGGAMGYDQWMQEKPFDLAQNKDKIDRVEEKYLADGSIVKVNILKGGRIIDMNGYECVGIADDALQMIDGTVIYDHPTSK